MYVLVNNLVSSGNSNRADCLENVRGNDSQSSVSVGGKHNSFFNLFISSLGGGLDSGGNTRIASSKAVRRCKKKLNFTY